MRPQLYVGSLARVCATCGKPFTTFPCRVRTGADKFCGRKCFGISKRRPHADLGWPTSGNVIDPSIASRFWAKVQKTNGCWLWQGNRTPQGYGTYHVNRRRVPAHRVAFALTNGPIGELFICHHCDNPPCVRPDHLFAGTAGDNLRDCLRKGRKPLGEQHGNAKLTTDLVLALRIRHQTSGDTFSQLAREYGVSPRAMRNAINGRTWAHLSNLSHQ